MTPPVKIDREHLVDLLRDLVQIDSVNPSLVDGAAGEAEIAAHVAGEMKRAGLEVETRKSAPGRVSVVGRLPGRRPEVGRSLMLNAHMDTVGVEGMEAPFSADVRSGRLYGRGAYDMKGALAACMEAARALALSGRRPAGDLVVAAVADEEYASLGTSELVEDGGHLTDGAVVTEPTGLDVCLAHKGFAWMRVVTRGRAAHGSQFDVGVDANLRMGRVMAALDRLEEEVRGRDPHPLVGPPSLHAPLVRGGTGISTYSDRCELKVERRTVPGESAEQVVGEVREIVDRLREEDPGFEAELETLLVRRPFEVEPDARVVRSVDESAKAVLGRRPERTGERPWMDSALLSEAGVETVVIGPTGEGAHAEKEWVELDSVEQLAGILATTALRYCGEA